MAMSPPQTFYRNVDHLSMLSCRKKNSSKLPSLCSYSEVRDVKVTGKPKIGLLVDKDKKFMQHFANCETIQEETSLYNMNLNPGKPISHKEAVEMLTGFDYQKIEKVIPVKAIQKTTHIKEQAEVEKRNLKIKKSKNAIDEEKKEPIQEDKPKTKKKIKPEVPRFPHPKKSVSVNPPETTEVPKMTQNSCKKKDPLIKLRLETLPDHQNFVDKICLSKVLIKSRLMEERGSQKNNQMPDRHLNYCHNCSQDILQKYSRFPRILLSKLDFESATLTLKLVRKIFEDTLKSATYISEGVKEGYLEVVIHTAQPTSTMYQKIFQNFRKKLLEIKSNSMPGKNKEVIEKVGLFIEQILQIHQLSDQKHPSLTQAQIRSIIYYKEVNSQVGSTSPEEANQPEQLEVLDDAYKEVGTFLLKVGFLKQLA
ncbi:unnamed protein product [Moneuplotes crassus]|uniref:Uncharacterized protein n=1 Tax=Euplotes crassus TaxID=5936 RepID=A0AAD1U4U7_EUPCR|nr:unnamed protein product [Moneuplotes crassus]